MTTLPRSALRSRRRGRELIRLGIEDDLRLEVRSDDEDGDSDDEDDIPSPKVIAASESDAEDSPSPTTTVFPPAVLSSSTPVLATITSTSTSTSISPPPPPSSPPPPATTTVAAAEPPPVLAPAVSETTTSTSSTLSTTSLSTPSSSSTSVVLSSSSSRPVVTVTPPARTTTIVSTALPPSDPPLVFSSESRTTLTTILPQTPKDDATSTLTSTSLASETANAPKESQTTIDGQRVYKEKQSDGPPGSMKVGIAFGTVAAVSLVVGILWCAWLIKRRRRRRNRGERLADETSFQDGSRGERGTASGWPAAGAMAAPTVKRSNESILNEVRQAAFGSSNSNGGVEPRQQMAIAELPATPFGPRIPHGFDEKMHDPSYPLPVLSPSRVEQPSIRKSIASWLRRTSRHHPLRLNPLGGRSNRTSMASSIASRGDHAFRTPSPGEDDVPPVPTIPPVNSQASGLAQPAPTVSKDDAAAYYRHLQNGSKPTLMPSVTDVSSEAASVQDVSPVESRSSGGTRGQEHSIYSLYASTDLDEKAYRN